MQQNRINFVFMYMCKDYLEFFEVSNVSGYWTYWCTTFCFDFYDTQPRVVRASQMCDFQIGPRGELQMKLVCILNVIKVLGKLLK